eukprot:2403990-Rhodomonas_salina.1
MCIRDSPLPPPHPLVTLYPLPTLSSPSAPSPPLINPTASTPRHTTLSQPPPPRHPPSASPPWYNAGIVPGGIAMLVKYRNNSTSIALPVLGSGMVLCDVGYWESVCSHVCDAVRSRERVCSGTRIGH